MLAHALAVGGGRFGGQNLLEAMGRVAPRNAYHVTIPSGIGYERICDAMPDCQTLVFGREQNLLRRLWHEAVTIPAAVKRFSPDVVLGLAHLYLRRPPCPQAMIHRDSHRV